jgi:hypothetical protein
VIYPVDGGFVISSNGSWLPGSYATKEAARWAYQFSDEDLTAIQNRVNRKEQRPITTEDLREVR